jgi:hypothetical protein
LAAGNRFTSVAARLSQFAMEFMIRRDGRELGPYSEAEIRSRLIAGTIALSDPGLAEGATEWAPLAAFAQFATTYREPVPPPIPAPSIASQPSVTKRVLESRKLGAYTAATLQPEDARCTRPTSIGWR